MSNEIKERAALDKGNVEKYAGMGASDGDIADILGISEEKLVRRYRKVLRHVRALRRIHLHQAQFTTAMKGNATLLTFLGKQELGQNDNRENMVEPVKGYVGIEVGEV